VKSLRPATTSYIAYLLLLVAFVLLGVFVAALARGSAMAPLAGIALLTVLGVSIAGFRAGASKLARASAAAEVTHKVSFWAEPLRTDQVDRYQLRYRPAPGEPAQPASTPRAVGGHRAASARHELAGAA
jgi:hypothetical protein